MKLLWMFLLGGISAFAQADMLPSESGISGPKYSSILKWEEQLKERDPSMVTLVPYGTSEKGRPLQLIVVKNPAREGVHPTLVMTGTTHGTEYLNIEDRLPEQILEHSHRWGEVSRFLDEGGAFVFVPIVNPDGYEMHQRENANGVDLNRDWDLPVAKFKGFKEKETRLLAKALERLRAESNLSYSITVDYHCCAGAVLYPWSYQLGPKLPKDKLQQFKELGSLATRHLPVSLGTTEDALGYSPLGTTKDYYYSHYGALSFTYEGVMGIESSKLAEHVAWWEDMIKWSLGSKTPLLFAHSEMQPLSPIIGRAD